ncbi:hypothetical protein [Solitalea lacus]|uniref:hypothetical protein n=1 Tax=Solitalea lacus TaxID=2911172 RepID=UPI001EDACD54|nr:hypothetical protein [Solitalea lacus]UKJ06833.1 hypothetical protein L2B55_15000 [Solitalea lacus]
MNKVITRIAIVGLCTALSLHTANAQSSFGLQQQFNAIVENANNYQDYKVIKAGLLRSLWKNANDSLANERKHLLHARTTISSQQQEIEQLKGNLNKQGISLQESKNQIDSIQLLGISISKGSYNKLMWSLVLILISALGFFIYRNKDFRNEANYRIKLFEELTEEFKTHKTKANEKEKRLARELQTERNRMEEILAAN